MKTFICALALLLTLAARAQEQPPPRVVMPQPDATTPPPAQPPLPSVPKAEAGAPLDKAAADAWAAQALADEERGQQERDRKERERKAREAAEKADAERAAAASRAASSVNSLEAARAPDLANAARPPLTAAQAATRSLLLPGLGQVQTGRPLRGYAFMAATGLSLISAIVLTARAKQANDIYNGAPNSVQSQAYDQARSYATARNVMWGVTALLWGGNVAESYVGYGTRDPKVWGR